MDHPESPVVQPRKIRIQAAVLLCLVGLLVNLLFSRLALLVHLPLYLDSVGVILSSALGGYIPGMIVGYLTNIINGIADPTTAYYSTLSVIIAFLAAIFTRRGWFKKLPTIILAIVIFALVGGALGSLLTWMLFGFDFGTGISAPLAHHLYDTVIRSVFWAQLSADYLIDLADKAVTVILMLVIYRLLPERVKSHRYFSAWRQHPLSPEEWAAARSSKGRTSLRRKFVLMLSIAMIIIAVVTMSISFKLFHRISIDNQCEMGEGVVNAAASVIDPERVEEFMTLGPAAEGYPQVEQFLINLRDSSADIKYVYVYKILEDGCHVVFDPDTADTPGGEPGEVIPFDDAFRPCLPALLAREPIDPIISNESFGWLLTLYNPLYDAEGNCVAYVGADISMADLQAEECSYMARVVSLFIGFFILILAVLLFLVDYGVIFPINTMALAAKRFTFDSEASRENGVSYVKSLDIRTGDEIEHLYRAFCKTSEDMVRYVADVHAKNETISRMQSRLIEVMADEDELWNPKHSPEAVTASGLCLCIDAFG